MTEERRYDDAEVREIFDRAAGAETAGQPARSSGTGLTLVELQEIGGEVGLSAERIAEAASRLGLEAGAPLRRTAFGQPLSVGRTLALPRALTDDEWHVLVGEIRETFQARGNVASHGDLREWTNGNLHVFIEATEGGHRIRLRSLKGSALAAQRLGIALFGMAVLLSVIIAIAGGPPRDFLVPLMTAMMGAGAIGSTALTLPRWAKEREEQMERIAARAVSLAEHHSEA